MVFARSRPSLLTILWVVIGIVVAASNGYFESIHDLSSGLSAVLAVLAWPLVLMHVNVAIG